MIGITDLATMANGHTRDRALRDYVRWEYGTSDLGWLFAAAREEASRKPKRDLRARLWYWLQSFRGYAAFDVRGVDDPRRT